MHEALAKLPQHFRLIAFHYDQQLGETYYHQCCFRGRTASHLKFQANAAKWGLSFGILADANVA